MKNYTLLEKNQLTHDVYELVFSCDSEITFIPGQFVTFFIPGIGARAYSILSIEDNMIKLIIKSVSLDHGGRGGSKYICEINLQDSLKGTPPAGNFLLNSEPNKKLFICTGTGLVPLYAQILQTLQNNNSEKIMILFGVRTTKDVFYKEILQKIKSEYNNFDFKIYLSQEDNISYSKGYVTEYLTQENTTNYNEFYICGIPNLIDSSIEILQKNNISDEYIYSEKYNY